MTDLKEPELGRVEQWANAKLHWNEIPQPVRRGYFVWAAAGVVLAIPEVIGSNFDSLFYSISRSVGRAEVLSSTWRLVVVALIAVGAVQAVIYRSHDVPDFDEEPREVSDRRRIKNVADDSPSRAQGARPPRYRTRNGHLTTRNLDNESDHYSLRAFVVYLTICIGAVAIAGWRMPKSQAFGEYWRGDAIYGAIFIALFLVPNLWAWRTGKAWFATTFATVASLRRGRPFVVMIILAGLAILVIHLVLYPWPDIVLTRLCPVEHHHILTPPAICQADWPGATS
jgi:hypothetical protein